MREIVLDLDQLKRIRLRERPRSQWALAYMFLTPQFRIYPRVAVTLEGYENVPSEPVIFAMNHTDYYTFFPFMCELIKQHGRYTSAWVKGKNYDSSFMAKFMEVTNNIPVASRGYIIARDFADTLGRAPSAEEYEALRRWVDEGEVPEEIPAAIRDGARNMLGRPFDPAQESYADAVNALFREMMRHFVRLNEDAFAAGNDLLVFPQGTRSVRLSRGHIGLAQIALSTRRTIVPVGASGCDLIYPGKSIIAKAGHAHYRFGAPISYEAMAPWHIDEPFEPFTPAAETQHRERFQGLVDHVMDRIDELVDPRHRYTSDKSSDGLDGIDRFI